MPRQRIHITDFNYGLMSEPDPRDIPLGAFATSSNTDPNSYGILRGVTASGVSHYAAANAEMSEWIVRDDGKRDLVYSDGVHIESLLDFYGTPAVGNTIVGRGYSFTPQNKKVFIGMGTSTAPKVALRIPAAKFNGLIAHTAGTGTDDLIIDASEYDGTAQTYYVKVTSIAGETGSFTGVARQSTDSTSGEPYITALFYDALHGLTTDDVGSTVVITGSTYYNGTYIIAAVQDPNLFTLRVTDSVQKVWYLGTDTGTWTLTKILWKWSLDDSTYYPTSYALSAKEFANISTHGLKAKFITPTGKDTTDKWAITFAAANAETLYIEDAECYNYQNNESTDTFSIAINVSGSEYYEEGIFSRTKRYFYGWSIIYDYTEESPIAYRALGNSPTCFNTDYNIKYTDVSFAITTSALPKRITGFNLWRADSDDKEGSQPTTEFKYLHTFGLDGSRVSSTTYTFKYKDTGEGSISYETQTGISEEVKSTSVKYTLSAQINDKLFVGNCSRIGITNATNVIFRSKALRYGTFDWATELLPLPTKPTAMLGFRGRLLVFDESKLYIIDPEIFSIQQQFNTGCPYSQGFAVTENAIYWADKNAFYKYEGIQPEDISTQKVRTTYQNIFSATSFNGIKCVYDATIKAILIAYRDTSDLKCLSYHVLNDKWDIFTLQTGYIATYWGVFAGKNGETYTSGEIAILRIFATGRRAWTATTGRINCGSPAILKKFYIIRVLSSSAPTLQFKIDGGTTTTITSSEEVKVSGTWGKGYDIQVILTDDAGTKEVYSADIYYRELGTR
jgi:hypothetical protein